MVGFNGPVVHTKNPFDSETVLFLSGVTVKRLRL